ncbi:MAG: tRNA (adenosine(37)-N6)-dimethylallyltransferase MiaA [Tissierellia bacterium]|nr:tRNA (adenosine(37)-N6)-dimethylallyltransferase MiaA [Tissierellia bacterium]
MRKFIVVGGPTGSGKSDMAVELAKRYHSGVISADSVQVYRHFDIGSGKITPQEMGGVTHHLLDVVDPLEEYTVKDFYEDATAIIDDYNGRGRIPVVCGGSNLYVHALLYELTFDEEPEARKISLELEAIEGEEGPEALAKLLEAEAPEVFKTIDQKNPRRVFRALQQVRQGIERPTQNLRRPRGDVRAPHLWLHWEREALYDRINRRVDLMMEQGLLEEVRHLSREYPGAKGLSTIGYREINDYLQGREYEDLSSAVEKVKQHSRNYAKRQITWGRKSQVIPIPMEQGRGEALAQGQKRVEEYYGSV